MKKFLKRIFVISVLSAIFVVVMAPAAYFTEMRLLKRDLTLDPGIKGAIIGDSRVEVYFDPSHMPGWKNFGYGGMPFAITAQKARLLATLNPDLKCIVIDVWPNKFFERLDVPFENVPEASALFEVTACEDMPPPSFKTVKRFLAGVLNPGITDIFYPFGVQSQLAGGFFYDRKFIEEKISERFPYGKEFPPPEKPLELPPVPVGGEIILEHLVRDLQAQGVNVVLTTTPVLFIDKRWTPEALGYFERRMCEISAKHGVPWYNWLHEMQDDLHLWADGLHINHLGAPIFTRAALPLLEPHARRLPTIPRSQF